MTGFNQLSFLYVMLSYRVLVNLINKRYAGHSKWANIKHIKATKDAQKSTLFTKFSRQIRVAVQEGGSANPDNNLKLSQVIEQARRNAMPVATIQNTLKSLNLKKDNCKSGILEIRGPSGCIVLCEVFTDNMTRLRQAMSPIVRKHNASFSDGGGRKLFEQKGVVEVEIQLKDKSEEDIMEIAMEHAIESGAEDVKMNSEETLQFISEPNDLLNVQKNLENFNYKILNSELDYIPNLCVELSEKDLENLSTMFDKLVNLEEVVRLYDNIG